MNEVREVPVIVSISQRDGRSDIRSCVSGYWAPPSKKFLAQFPRVRTEAEALQLVAGVAELFADTTHQGVVKNLRNSWQGQVRRATADVWSGDQLEATVELLQMAVDEDDVDQFVLLRDPEGH